MKKSQTCSWIFLLVLIVYQCLWHLFSPVALLRLWWKGKKEPGYRKQILERFGFYQKDRFQGAIWVHAVSVGETRAAAPLVEELIAKGHRILLTHMTPTGRATGLAIFSKEISSGQLIQAYLPYDFCWPVSRFYRHYRPHLGLLMETEVWPSLLFFARDKFPIQLINGRLSLKSSLSFLRFGRLSHDVFGMFDSVLAQTQADCDRYKALGVKECWVTGNLKFDVQLSQEQVMKGQTWKHCMADQKILCAASTREGEEELIINAWLTMTEVDRPLLLIVPRHLTRVPELEQILQSHSLSFTKRSQMDLLQAVSSQILIGDSMGEMPMYLAVSDVVIMGGSWKGTGGQNLIEPIALGKPVIVGPSMYNFAQVTKDALSQGIVWQIDGQSDEKLSHDLGDYLKRIMRDDLISKISLQTQGFAQNHQGATLNTIKHLKLEN
jgi:3-deoxy-D-manno-octulosonic-acid transferase